MRLIDADELLERMKTIENFSNQKGMFTVTREMIENAPTVNAVPVVRCKDCKYAARYAERNETCGWVAWYNKDDDFCSRGERKE